MFSFLWTIIICLLFCQSNLAIDTFSERNTFIFMLKMIYFFPNFLFEICLEYFTKA